MRASHLGAALAAAALLLLPAARALGVQRGRRAPHIRTRTRPEHLPVVYVQRDFFEGLVQPPDDARLAKLELIDRANFSMGALYGAPICTGKGWFVDEGRAPSAFCRHKNKQVDESIEGRWHPEFDEYALEKIMLGKWLESPIHCGDSNSSCDPAHADLVVIPSPFVSVAMQLGWKWKNVWTLNLESFKTYWQLVQARYFKDGRAPLVVVHVPYCWAKANFLRALMEQPPNFISSVVVAGIESNLRTPERAFFGPQWSGSGLEQLRRRAMLRAKQHSDPAAVPPGEPLLFVLPYPTSILKAVSFSESEPSTHYNAGDKRKVDVSFTGNLSKSSTSNWIRTLVHTQISDRGAEPTGVMVNSSIFCPSYKSWRPNCGLGIAMSMWDIVADSTFCLEPPGDTPTRSHFYMAVQSGCVPVLFNGGHTEYQENEPGWFAWRKASDTAEKETLLPDGIEALFKDPNKMAVVFNSSDVRDGKVDFIQELIDMPSKTPKRLKSLRKGLDSAAKLMTFSNQAPRLWLPGCDTDGPKDAFEGFQGIMVWEAQQKDHAGSWC